MSLRSFFRTMLRLTLIENIDVGVLLHTVKVLRDSVLRIEKLLEKAKMRNSSKIESRGELGKDAIVDILE